MVYYFSINRFGNYTRPLDFAGQDDAPRGDLKEMVAPMRRRFALPFLRKAFHVSERRACRVLAVCRATLKYKSVKIDVPALRARINEIAAARVRYGYPRIHVLLRREGWLINRKTRVPHLPRRRPVHAAKAATPA